MDLFDAIRQGDSGTVRALMVADPRAGEARNSDGATVVLWAVYTRHAELAPILLDGRDPDFFEACALGRRARAEELLAALGLAIFFGHAEIARMLVEARADVNASSRNSIQVTPLHAAIAAGDVAMLDLLLAHGAAADPEEFLGATPLHSAAAHGSREMVERLLKAGADPKKTTNEGKTAADLARQHGHPELVELRLPR